MWDSQISDGIDLEVFDPPARRDAGAVLLLRPRRDGLWAEQSEWTKHLSEMGLCALAPQRGEGWWFDRPPLDHPERVTDMQTLIDTIVPLFEKRWNITPPRIAVVGVDAGGAAAFGLAYRHARKFPIVAAIQPAIDFHRLAGHGREVDSFFESREAARQQTAPLHVHPLDWPKKQWLATHPDDPWHEGCERLLSKLDSIGIPCERVIDDTAPTPDAFLKQHIRPALEFVLQCLHSH